MKSEKTYSLPLDKFINLALYKKNTGYYMKKIPFGKNGDFITSPKIVMETLLDTALRIPVLNDGRAIFLSIWIHLDIC